MVRNLEWEAGQSVRGGEGSPAGPAPAVPSLSFADLRASGERRRGWRERATEGGKIRSGGSHTCGGLSPLAARCSAVRHASRFAAETRREELTGVDFNHSDAAHKHMPTSCHNPRLLLLRGVLGDSDNGFSSFSSIEQVRTLAFICVHICGHTYRGIAIG